MWRRVEWRKEAVFGESAISEFRFGDAIAFVAVPGDCYDHAMKRWHAWLELARISNLPTVWTNVLAGWLLAGGAWTWDTLGWLFAGGSLLYTAGMILNDAMDVKFDREHRKERPIPSGRISAATAWTVGMGMLVAGAAMSFFGAGACGWLVLVLMGAILLYDVFHKPWAGSVLIMGACRVLLYLMAGSAVTGGLSWDDNWELVVKALALGGYIVGVSLVARMESSTINAVRLPQLFLGVGCLVLPLPAAIAPFMAQENDVTALVTGTCGLVAGMIMVVIVSQRGVRKSGFLEGPPNLVSWVFWVFMMIPYGLQIAATLLPELPYWWFGWGPALALLGVIALAMQWMRTPPPSNIGRGVGLLLAGIVIVDALAINGREPLITLLFLIAMPLLLLCQRKIAAT
jgi:4-hydroxybenzoate polyprenyltransferase